MALKKLFMFFTLLVIITAHSACKKESTDSKTKTQLITEQSWILVSFRYNFNNGAWTDGYATIPNCQKDNKLLFQSNFDCILDEGITKCNSSDPQIFQQGSWLFLSNETKLSTTYNGSTAVVDIVQLDNSSMKTSRKDTTGTNTSITEANYIH